MIKLTLLWKDPINLATIFLDQKYLAFLYSAYINNFTGEKSYLCICHEDVVSAENFTPFEEKLMSAEYSGVLDRWFGYLSYDLKNELEKLPIDEATYISAPKSFMVKYNVIFEFDHKLQVITLHARDNTYLDYAVSRYSDVAVLSLREGFGYKPTDAAISVVLEEHKKISLQSHEIAESVLRPPHNDSQIFSSNMTDEEYFRAFDFIMESIKAGDIYQANLTRKFYGEVAESEKKFDLFRTLSSLSPSPYSAYFKFDDLEIISSSPEQFLTIDAEGFCSARPIKGTARRSNDPEEDALILETLKNCPKNRAENLMITDLMRNDFARSSVTGSVNVKNLFEVTTYRTLHHMSSTVTSIKRPDISSLEFVKRAFPPGSMTGCPKIKAMEICSKVEKLQRGIYSGVLGYFGEDGVVDLSVIIRTIVFRGNKFEFQVGGAITYDSTKESELEEIYIKAKAIMRTLSSCFVIAKDANETRQNNI
jgi:para-aminobenzoate synthetase component 1